MLSLFLFTAGLGGLRPFNGVALPPSQTTFDFIALGDNRPVGAGLPLTAVFKGIVQNVIDLDPTFVISSGDIVFGKDESMELYDKECDAFTSLVKTIPCPFFNAPGNHEINERQDFYDDYTKRFGPTYGTFEYGGWRFVAISTEEVGFSPAVAPTEVDWLKTALAGPEPKICFHHHPVYVRPGNDEKGAGMTNHDEVEALFKTGNVKIDFEGHDHVYNHQTHDGIEYYISGGAGAPLDAPPQDGGFFHFNIVHVTGDTFTVDTIPVGAIQITKTKTGVVVQNYSDFPLHFRRLRVPCASAPTSVTAKSVKKKAKPVEAKIVGSEKTVAGYVAYIDVTAPEHIPTFIDVK